MEICRSVGLSISLLRCARSRCRMYRCSICTDSRSLAKFRMLSSSGVKCSFCAIWVVVESRSPLRMFRLWRHSARK